MNINHPVHEYINKHKSTVTRNLCIMPVQYRDDHVSGWVYLIEAEGYHGYIPGVYLRRCKIGLTRSVENRLDALHSSQPPCNYKVVRAIYVSDMAAIEDALHKRFKHCNVKLIKSREWFDILPHQYAILLWMFSRYDSKRMNTISPRLIVSALVALLGVGLLIGYYERQVAIQRIEPGIERTKN